MKRDLYTEEQSDYLNKNQTWHIEDSAWKAKQIIKILSRNEIQVSSIVEVGCGAGEILRTLDKYYKNDPLLIEGFDIAGDAINMALSQKNNRVTFHNRNFLLEGQKNYDLLLMIDVFEHVADYIGFIQKCNTRAKYKIYHIPLDISVSSVLRKKMIYARNQVGHLHYFTKETALETLKDSGQEIIDCFYTAGAIESSKMSMSTQLANFFRKALFKISPSLTVRLLGGYSLLVLTK